jgi:hypothetical protein
MTRIRLYDHPLAPVAPQLFEAESIGQWLLDHYGDVPSVRVQVFRGEPCAENEISDDLAALMTSDADEYTILQSPGDPMTIFYVVMAVSMVAAIVLMPKPVLPGNVNRTQQSPNNSLGARENKVRMLERVEDIYGTVRSIPSLMMPTYIKYISHKKYEYGYYCVGRGYHTIAEIRDGDTLIDDIDGAAASVYDPFTSPNSGSPVQTIGAGIIDKILTVARKIEVDGITLSAPNQKQLPASGSYQFETGNRIVQFEKTPNFNAVLDVGDQVTVTMSDFYETTGGVSDGEGGTTPVEVVSGPYNYSGTYTVLSVGDGAITVDGAAWARTSEYTASSVQIVGGESTITDWVTLPAVDRTEVWCNIIAQNGMFKDGGGGKEPVTTTFQIEIERLALTTLTPTGQLETVTGSLSGSTDAERADTIEHATAWTGPARVRMQRTSAYDFAFEGTVVDEIKWADLYSVSPVSKAEFGNKTTIHTITEANSRATAVKSRQLNCIASRKLPTYNGTAFSGAFDATGRHVSGTIAATSKIADIIAAVSQDPKIGARDLATEVDMSQIWSVQQKLNAWNSECGQFNYTFDSDNISFEETVTTIANAAFCIAYRQNGKIRLALDEAQNASTALFTHRNKKPKAETITRTFANDADYDGVEFVYVDPESNQSETITLPLNGDYTKLKKYEIAGIRSFKQAWLRANRELQKLLGQRITIETETTMDARSLLPNARIDIVDNTRFKSYDGEVVGQDGLEITLSQKVEFTPGLPHSIVLMRRDGSLQSIPVAPGSWANKVILQSLPTEAIVTNYGAAGIRTIYSFAADTTRGSQAYLVQELDLSDGQYIKIRAINYSPDYYAMDRAIIPAKAGVIN